MKWDVYQEVQTYYSGPIADIVAVQNGVVWVVETKKTLSLALIEQGYKWTRDANYVSVAVPRRRRGDYGFGAEVCKKYKLGVLSVADPSEYSHGVSEVWGPKLHRKAMTRYITDCLTPEHKTFAKAGTSTGKRYTPFQGTCITIKKAVESSPGMKLKELVESIDHHYSSSATARSCISKWAQQGIIEGVRCEKEGRFLRFYPDEGIKDEKVPVV